MSAARMDNANSKLPLLCTDDNASGKLLLRYTNPFKTIRKMRNFWVALLRQKQNMQPKGYL